MSRDVHWVLPDITVALAAKMMDVHNLDLLPVCSAEGTPLGIVTDRDIAVRVVAKDRPAASTQVDEVMTRAPQFVSPETPAERVVELMSHEGTSRLLVIDGAGKLDGIVSLSDLLIYGPAELALAAAKGVYSWEMDQRSVASPAPSGEPDGVGEEGDRASAEIENPARAEAETVVRGGTNDLKEFPG